MIPKFYLCMLISREIPCQSMFLCNSLWDWGIGIVNRRASTVLSDLSEPVAWWRNDFAREQLLALFSLGNGDCEVELLLLLLKLAYRILIARQSLESLYTFAASERMN